MGILLCIQIVNLLEECAADQQNIIDSHPLFIASIMGSAHSISAHYHHPTWTGESDSWRDA